MGRHKSAPVVACIRAIVEELLDKCDGQHRDGSVEHALGGASGSVAAEPLGITTDEQCNCLVLPGSRLPWWSGKWSDPYPIIVTS